MPEATWEPYEKQGRLTTQSDLPNSVYAFPKQRKEPLTDADRALAFANIEKAAGYYGVNLSEMSWHELGIHPQENRKDAAAKGVATRERRGRN